jgi:hypothetical protein
MNPFAQKKVVVFGVLGALGCLAGWLVGEGFLAAALPSKDDAGGNAPSLASRPDASKLDAAKAPPRPEQPKLQARQPPPPLPADFNERLKAAGGKSGQLQFTLIWGNRNDLDLHCFDPNGELINYQNKKAIRSGGHLDVDRNVNGETDTPVENIYYPDGDAPLGTYRIYVVYYSRHDAQNATKYQANLLIEDKRIPIEGEIAFDGSQTKKLIQEFALPGFRIAAAPEVILFPGQKNTILVRIERDRRNQEPVFLRLGGDLAGLVPPAREVVIPAGSNEAEIEIAASDFASGGARALTIVGTCKYGKAEAVSKAVVQISPPVLQIAAPPAVQVQVGGKNRMTVLIARANVSGTVTIRPETESAGLRFAATSIPEGQTEAEIEVSADAAANLGDRSVTLLASSDSIQSKTRFDVTVHAAPRKQLSWLMVLIISCWTALLAIGMSLALVVGQNRYLSRPWLAGREACVLLLAAGLAGLVAGGIGQALYGLLASAEVLPQVGFIVGWLLLGGLLGRGIGLFIPNLNGGRAALAGITGGLIGALAFIVISRLGDVPGRLVGAGILGFCIGLMVALVEIAFRKAWLEVRYGSNESISVNLGAEPVKIGGDGKACTVWARGAAPVAFRFWLREGKVLCEDVVGKKTEELSNGAKRQAGSMQLIVHAGTDTISPKAVTERVEASKAVPEAPKPVAVGSNPRELRSPTPPPQVSEKKASPPPPPPQEKKASPPPPPPKPVTAKSSEPTAAKPGASEEACVCGRKVPGLPGQRYCVVCDRTF